MGFPRDRGIAGDAAGLDEDRGLTGDARLPLRRVAEHRAARGRGRSNAPTSCRAHSTPGMEHRCYAPAGARRRPPPFDDGDRQALQALLASGVAHAGHFISIMVCCI
jgi:hypothetical protein